MKGKEVDFVDMRDERGGDRGREEDGMLGVARVGRKSACWAQGRQCGQAGHKPKKGGGVAGKAKGGVGGGRCCWGSRSGVQRDREGVQERRQEEATTFQPPPATNQRPQNSHCHR